MENPPASGVEPPYIAYRAPAPITVDGRLDEPAWRLAPKSPRFVDVVSGTPAHYESRAAVVWDDEALYVGFWIEEPFVRARQTDSRPRFSTSIGA